MKTKQNFKLALFFIFILFSSKAFAQEYKIAVKTGKLHLNTFAGSATIEAYNGNEIVIQAPERNIPEDAQGLKRITGGGEDNTGLGLNFTQNGDAVELVGVTKKESNYKILIPEKMSLIANLKGWQCANLKIINFKAELEIKVQYTNIQLSNVTGPVVLNATYGKVKVNFDNVNQAKPMSIIAAYSDVDVSLPENTKANLKLQSEYGDIYTDFTIAYDKSNEEDNLKKLSKSFISGTINGGGVEIYIKAPYNNIYLRKKK